MKGTLGLSAASLVWLAWASVAYAQPPSQVGYGGAANVPGGLAGGAAGEVVSPGGAGVLPFTGFDLFALAVAGALLLAAGIVVRRLTRAKSRT